MLRQKMEHGERGFVKRVKRRKNVWRKSEIISLKKLAEFRKLFLHCRLTAGVFIHVKRRLERFSCFDPSAMSEQYSL